MGLQTSHHTGTPDYIYAAAEKEVSHTGRIPEECMYSIVYNFH